MPVDEIDQCTNENRVGLTETGRCIHQSTIAIGNMLPGLFLEGKGLNCLASSQRRITWYPMVECSNSL